MPSSVSAAFVLALALPLAACGGRGGDPAVYALRACIESSPYEVCPRLAVEGREGRTIADSAYWADALGDRPEAFYDAAEACTRASLAGSPVGTAGGVTRAARELATAQADGTLPADAQLDPGVCYDVYLVYSEASPEHRDLGSRLERPEIVRLAAEARAARNRSNIRALADQPSRSYDGIQL